jgi:uncharacterized protein (DUF1499 family)
MTVAAARTASGAAGLLRGFAVLGLVAGVIAVGLLAAGPVGWRVGWWNYRVAFSTLMPCGFYCGVGAMVLSLPPLVAGMRPGARRGVWRAAIGLVLGATAAYFPWHAYEIRGAYPPMHDITTDFTDPPSLEFSAGMRVAEQGASPTYPGADTAAMQQKFYPGIEAVTLAAPPPQVFARVLAIVEAKGWTIVKSDPAAGIIDAYDRSLWFGFADDIAVRVTASDTGSRVDIRSSARQGRGDFGVNAARVRAFLAALKAQG